MRQTSGPRRRSRARAAVLWGLAGLAGLQLGLSVVIDCCLPQLRNPEAGFKARRLAERCAARPAPGLTVVMLGSSRTAWGFRPGLVEEDLGREAGAPAVVFNLGITGGGPVTELLLLRRVLADGVRPDLVAVEVLPPLLAGQGPAPLEARWLSAGALRLGELAVAGQYRIPLGGLRRDWLESWLVPWYAHRFNLLSQAAPDWLPWAVRKDWVRTIDATGWATVFARPSSPDERRRALANARQEYIGWLVGFRLGEPACRAVRDLLALCRQARIPVVLVLMPEGRTFQGWYPPAAWAQIAGFLDGLSREYAAPVINARDWVADEEFFDAHHLLPRGAEIFTRRFGAEVLRVLREQGRIRPSAISYRLSADSR
jgi:hypothetical protein